MKNGKLNYNEWTIEKFVREANKVHNNLYDYSQSVYKGYVNKINIVCKKHGEFNQHAKSHLAGNGCRVCAYELVSKKNTGWNSEQEKVLLENFEKMSMAKIAKLVGKAEQTVRFKAKKMGLKRKSRKMHFSIPNCLWINLMRGARDRNLEVTITVQDIWNQFVKQQKKCALTGWEIKFVREKSQTTASVDRIDSTKGYTIDNIQIVHKKVNKLKMDFAEKDLFAMCKAIANNTKIKNIPRTISHWELDIWNDTEIPVYNMLKLDN